MRHPSWDDEFRPKPKVGAAPASPQAGADRPYAEGWDEYRAILRRIWLVTMLGGLSIAALVWLLTGTGAETVLGFVFPLLAMVWFGSSLYSLARLVGFSCPRCGHAFFNPLMSPAFQNKCRECGLRKFAVNDQPSRFRKVP
jgi:hypothetical protein